MLNYHPEKRATAQQMLSHPWLNSDSNYDYLMTEREYEKLNMIKKNKKEDRGQEEDKPIPDVVESENELNLADDEDNEEYVSDDNNSEDSGADPDINIQNFNNSFAAYGQHVNLAALDRANPQFSRKK